MSLSDAKIRSTKPSDKPFKLADSHGPYLLVNPGGSRLWYLKYRFNRKESRIALGAYPLVSLSDARQQRDGIRKLLAHNINPALQWEMRSCQVHCSKPEKRPLFPVQKYRNDNYVDQKLAAANSVSSQVVS